MTVADQTGNRLAQSPKKSSIANPAAREPSTAPPVLIAASRPTTRVPASKALGKPSSQTLKKKENTDPGRKPARVKRGKTHTDEHFNLGEKRKPLAVTPIVPIPPGMPTRH